MVRPNLQKMPLEDRIKKLEAAILKINKEKASSKDLLWLNDKVVKVLDGMEELRKALPHVTFGR